MTEDPRKEPGRVQSVVRAFDILEALADSEGNLSLAAIAERTRLPAPTAHRLLRTLVSGGHVQQLGSRDYALGSALIRLGDRATPDLSATARPVLEELEEVSQETANLAVLNGDRVTYIGQVPSRHRMRMFTEIGRSVLPHAAGVGKAILSALPEQRTLEIVRRTGLPRYTSTTLCTEDELLENLREARQRGFAVDDSEQEVGVRCIAVPVPGMSPPAAVSISGPVARVTDEMAPGIIEALTSAARTLSGL